MAWCVASASLCVGAIVLGRARWLPGRPGRVVPVAIANVELFRAAAGGGARGGRKRPAQQQRAVTDVTCERNVSGGVLRVYAVSRRGSGSYTV